MRFLAASTQSLGPLRVMLSLCVPVRGKLTATPPYSSASSLRTCPLRQTKWRWCRGSTTIVSSMTSSCCRWNHQEQVQNKNRKKGYNLWVWIHQSKCFFKNSLLFCHTRFLIRISSSFWASCTASSLPMMVIVSCSGSSGEGKMIRAPVRSRTRRILAPPRPIRNLWYSGFAWSSTEKLLTCWWKNRQMYNTNKNLNGDIVLLIKSSLFVLGFPVLA